MWFDVAAPGTFSKRPGDHNGCRIRGGILFSMLILGFVALLGRLYYIQCIRHAHYRDRAQRTHVRVFPIPSERGTIYDRRGRILAVSLPIESVYADPLLIRDRAQAAEKLSEALGIDRESILARLSRKKRFVWLQRKVPAEVAARVTALGLDGVGLRKERTRTYPKGVLACHILGLVDVDGNGLSGMERALDEYLKGTAGFKEVEVDATGRTIYSPALQERAPVNGMNLVLAIDSMIQAICEEELDAIIAAWSPKWAGAIVMDPAGGDILAMARRPGFDPNDRSTFSDETRRLNVIEDRIEPGSIFKPIVVAGALEAGIVEPSTRIFCHNGLYQYGSRVLHDHHPYGWLTVHEVVVHSSNIGAARIGQMIGVKSLYGLVRKFGFGQPTGLGLAGEAPGRVNPLASWSGGSLLSVPMGHEISATPLQMVRAFAALGNDGVLPTPKLALGLLTSEGRVAKSFGARPQQIIGRGICSDTMTPILEGVVKSGTGKKAASQRYSVAGKTGTAQMINEDGSYSHSKFVSSFVGFAPARSPKVVVMVVVAEPRGAYYGGTVAAPGTGRIIDRTLTYMGVPPDATGEFASSGKGRG